MPRRHYDQVASRQLGLVSGSQLRSLRWGREQVRHAVRIGLLEVVRHNVYRTAGSPRSREQSLLAAVLAAPGSVLSHGTSARTWRWTLVAEPGGIDLLRERNRPRLAGVIGHETDHLPPHHRTIRHSLPVTTPARTLIDCCGMLSPSQLRSTANDGLRRKILTLPKLVRAVDEVPVSGRRAIVPVCEFLRTKVAGYDPGDSDPEVDLVELLVAAGYQRPAQQIRVETDRGTFFLDVGWRDVRVGFEYDSVEFHVERFHDDRDRLRALKRAGWDIWPVTSTTSKNEILVIASLAFRHERAA